MPEFDAEILFLQGVQQHNERINMSGGQEDMRDSLAMRITHQPKSEQKTKDQCVAAAFKEMTGKALSTDEIELMKILLSYWSSK